MAQVNQWVDAVKQAMPADVLSGKDVKWSGYTPEEEAKISGKVAPTSQELLADQNAGANKVMQGLKHEDDIREAFAGLERLKKSVEARDAARKGHPTR